MYFGLHMNSLDFSFGKVIRVEVGVGKKIQEAEFVDSN
jgi:hypothetical protein